MIHEDQVVVEQGPTAATTEQEESPTIGIRPPEATTTAPDNDNDKGGNNDDQNQPPVLHLLLDAGYGIPRESRPRQEKILAMAKQIANFLQWQQHEQQQRQHPRALAPVTVIGCHDEDMKRALIQRLERLLDVGEEVEAKQEPDMTEHTSKDGSTLRTNLPSHFSFANDDDNDKDDSTTTTTSTGCLLQPKDAIYLSPDAPLALNPHHPPPSKVIVGLLIDRRVQVNRSLQRSEQLQLRARRWPMEALAGQHAIADIHDNHTEQYHHPQEPLNVDTILEALQRWSWNYYYHCNNGNGAGQDLVEDDTAFVQASLQAFQHHAKRHPARPHHRTPPTTTTGHKDKE